MGVSIYVRFENGTDLGGGDINGKALSRAQETLDKYAIKAGVKPLMSFFSASSDDVGMLLDEPVDPATLPKEEWFEASDGLATVRKLKKGLNSAAIKDQDAVLADLDDLERILTAAKAEKVRFHICVDF